MISDTITGREQLGNSSGANMIGIESTSVLTSAESNETAVQEAVIDHVLGCDICLGVITDLTLSTSMCEVQCTTLREILSSAEKPSYRVAAM